MPGLESAPASLGQSEIPDSLLSKFLEKRTLAALGLRLTAGGAGRRKDKEGSP
mgnify:CR=1